jgi:hydroxymethylglutaryl-CoA lyase
MGFGNPYGESWSSDIVSEYTKKIVDLGVNEIILSDTTGESSPEKIRYLFPLLKENFPTISLGLHLHSKPQDTNAKLRVALELGCTMFDTALRGFGGCPMAKDDLVGNIATENLIALLNENNIPHHLNMDAWNEALAYSWKVFAS